MDEMAKDRTGPAVPPPGTEQPPNSSANGRDAEIDFMKMGDIINITEAAKNGRRQKMTGFDSDYVDIVDYIIRVTHRIWDEGGMGLLYRTYTHNTPIWSDWGVNYGREKTLEYVIQGLTESADHHGYAQDVIWAGNDVDGFKTSHRGIATGHNTGYSKFGPPTGRRFQAGFIANCVVKENYITEEWLVHDDLTQVYQLGLDVDEVLQNIALQRESGSMPPIIGEVARVEGQTTPQTYVPKHPGSFDVEDFVQQQFSEIWNWRLLNKIPVYYSPTCPIHGPSRRELYGLGQIRAWVLALMTAFPDAMIQVDDLYWNGNEKDGYRAAIRWTLLGTNRLRSMYGQPTGKQVRVMGFTHQHIKEGKIREEWTLFNELALLYKLRYGA